MLGIDYDSYAGESFYSDKMPAIVEDLKEKNLLVESKGAMIVDLEPYGLTTGSDSEIGRLNAVYHQRPRHVQNTEKTLMTSIRIFMLLPPSRTFTSSSLRRSWN